MVPHTFIYLPAYEVYLLLLCSASYQRQRTSFFHYLHNYLHLHSMGRHVELPSALAGGVLYG